MKKVLLMGFTKIAYMPYMNFYLEALDGADAEIHVVKWQRDQEADIALGDDRVVVHEFARTQADEVAKFSKIGNFLKYRAFVKRLLKRMGFDRIIVLHTLPGVLIADVLLRKYREKFILDYRDYTYESFSPFKKLIGALVNASYATFVSSDAFREALPKVSKVYTSHNLLVDSLNHRDVRSAQSREHTPIRIAFWGFIRHEAINREIIRKLGNDDRFELHYYGREQQTALNLKAFTAENNYKNVVFHGRYKPKDRYDFAAKTDILHNMYENDMGMRRAMGNKYYDGLVFRIPQVCNIIGSYMGERVVDDGAGIALDPFEDLFPERLYEYYSTMDWQSFASNCDLALKRVVDEYEEGKRIIRGFVEK